mgnify:CR=1 FL=1
MNQNNTNMGMENDEITIDLMDLFQVVFKKLHLVLLAGIIAALVAVLVTKLFMTPVYTSTTKMYVLSKQDANSAVTSSDLQAGSQLTKDYMELIKSRSVMEQVISQLQLDMSVDKLSGEITVSNTADTRILSISVENESPKLAKEIADAVRESASVQITQITDADAVNMVEEGNLPKDPTSPNTMKNAMLGGILGIFLALGAIVLIYILDDTIKTPDDVERYLGLTVLTSIPIASGTPAAKKVRGLSSTEIYKKEWKEVSGKEKKMREIVLNGLEKDFRSNEAYKNTQNKH